MLHVTGPVAHDVSVADGVTVIGLSSSVAGGSLTATVTVPTLWFTEMLKLPVPDCPAAAVAVTVNGPWLPAWPQLGVHATTPVLGSKLAPAGSAGAMLHVTGPNVQVPNVADGVTVIALCSGVGG